MQKDKYFMAFSYLLNVSPYFKVKLLEYFNFDVERAWNCKKADLSNFKESISKNFFTQKDKIDPDKCFDEINKKKIKYITCLDKKYPKLLKEIADYPIILYYKGEFERCYFDKTLAIVGSRRATESAKGAVSKIISTMSNLPLTIVSGLALGIDAVAHRASIQNNISTIGVIGSGFDYVYPPLNKDLYKIIEEEKGLILSEYPPSTAPLPMNFPQRNRIITGLSYGVLVAEAAIKSGALISANLALEQNREVMCIPGVITNPNTEGIYKLVKEGAPIVTSSYDIFEILNWDFSPSSLDVELTGHEKIIFDIIQKEAVSFEKIQSEAKDIEPAEIMVILTGLEIKGLIRQKNGQYLL